MANRNELRRIDPAFLMVGSVYQLRSKSLGTANVQFLGGSKIKVVRGELVLPSSGKRLRSGSVLSLPTFAGVDFYELNDPVVAEEPEEMESEE
jgi:hypothetical protein